MLGLSILELHLFVAVLHLHGRHLQGSASSGGGSGSSNGVASNGTNGASGTATAGKSGGDNCAVAMVVRQALTVCDMLVEMFKQKVSHIVSNNVALCFYQQAVQHDLSHPAVSGIWSHPASFFSV